MKRCPNCQELNGNTKATCFACGADFYPPTTESLTTTPTNPASQTKDIHQPMVAVLKIAVPRNTLWQPQVAVQLMESLFSLAHLPIKLVISLTSQYKVWLIEVPYPLIDLVQNSLSGLYPGVEFQVEPKSAPSTGYEHFIVETGYEFVAPLKYAEEINQAAPLVSFVNATRSLAPDEHVLLEMTIKIPEKNYAYIGEQLITKSLIKATDYFSVGGAIDATLAKRKGKDRIDKYRPEDQEVLRDKIYRTLAEVRLILKIRAATEARIAQITLGLGTAFELVTNHHFNWLTLAEPGLTYPLVLCAPEAAALWHLPSHHFRATGMVWSSQVADDDLKVDTEPEFYEVVGLPPEHYTTEPTFSEQISDHLSLEELEASFGDGLRHDYRESKD